MATAKVCQDLCLGFLNASKNLYPHKLLAVKASSCEFGVELQPAGVDRYPYINEGRGGREDGNPPHIPGQATDHTPFDAIEAHSAHLYKQLALHN